MEFLYTFLLVIIVGFLLIGFMQARAKTNQTFYRRNYPLGADITINPIDPNNPIDPTKEYFVNSLPTIASDIAQAAGASIQYKWGQPIDTPTPVVPAAGSCPAPSTCRDGSSNQATCDSCDILKHKDIKYFTLKSSIPACPDMNDYVKKSQVPPMPNMRDYIKKSQIPVCEKCPDLSDYIPRSSVPAMPECPKCPVCPVCPVCPETYDRVEQDPRFGRAFANADIRRHPDISKYVLKSEAQVAMQTALKVQAQDIVKNLRCPPCADGSQRDVQVMVKDATTGAIINPKLRVEKDVKLQAVQIPNAFGSIFPGLSDANDAARKLPREIVEKRPEIDYDFVFQKANLNNVPSGMGSLTDFGRSVGDVIGGFFKSEERQLKKEMREDELNRQAFQKVPSGTKSNMNLGSENMEIWTDSVLPSKSCSVPNRS